MSLKEKITLFVGVVFITLAFILNPFLLRRFLSEKEIILHLANILFREVLLLAVGISLIVFRKRLQTLPRILMTKNYWVNLSLAAFSFFVIYIFLEIAIRIFFSGLIAPSYTLTTKIIKTNHTSILIGERGFKEYNPGLVFREIYPSNPRGYFGPDNGVEYTINSAGFRGQLVTDVGKEDIFRIICLGDSIVFGQGVKDKDTFTEQLERLMNQSRITNYKKAEVLNFGVQATGTSDQVRLLKDRIAKYRPNLVMLFYYLNDCGGGVFDFMGANKVSERRNRIINFLIDKSYLFNFVYNRISNFIQTNLMVFFYNYTNSFHWEYFHQNLDFLKELKSMSEQYRFDYILLVYPVLYNLDNYPFKAVHNRLRGFAVSNEIQFIDILDAFKEKGFDGPELWVHPIDQHPNEIASGILANFLYKKLKSYGYIQ